MTGYGADLERLDAGARDLRGFAGQATEIAGTLDKALAAFGVCWGDDAVGRSFGTDNVGARRPVGAGRPSSAVTRRPAPFDRCLGLHR